MSLEGWKEVVKGVWRNPAVGDVIKVSENSWQFIPTEDFKISPKGGYTDRYFFGTLENVQRKASDFIMDAKVQGVHPFDMPSQNIFNGWIEGRNDFQGRTGWTHPKYGGIMVSNKTGKVLEFNPFGNGVDWTSNNYAMPERWGTFKSLEEASQKIPPMMEEAKKTGRAPWLSEKIVLPAGALEQARKRKAETDVVVARENAKLDAKIKSFEEGEVKKSDAVASIVSANAGRRIIIIPCSATKNPVSGPTPARDLYTGSNFQGNLKAAIAQVGEANVRIMSAKHGLLELDQKIEPYDVKMGSKESLSQNMRRFTDFGLQLSDLRGAQIETMLPQQYLKILKKAAALPSGIGVEIGVDHFAGSRGIGDQRSMAKKLLGLGTNPVPPMPKVTLGKAKPVEAPAPVAKTDAQKVAEIAQHYLAKPDALVGRNGVIRTSDPTVVATDPTAIHHPHGLLAAIRVGLDRGDDKKVLLKALNALYKMNGKIFESKTGIPQKEFPKKLVERLAFAEKLVADTQYDKLFNSKPEPEPKPVERTPMWGQDQSPMSPEEAQNSAYRYNNHDSIYDFAPPELKSLIDRKREILKQYNPLEQQLENVARKPADERDAWAKLFKLTPQYEQYKALGEKLGHLESQIQYVRYGLPAPPAPKGMLDAEPAPTPTQVAAGQMAQQAAGKNPAAQPSVYTSYYTPAHEARLQYLTDKYPAVTAWQPLGVSSRFKPANALEENEARELIALTRLQRAANNRSSSLDPLTGKSKTAEIIAKFEQTGNPNDKVDASIAAGVDSTWQYQDMNVNPVPPFTESNLTVDRYRQALSQVRELYKAENANKDDEVKAGVAEIVASGILGAGFAASKSRKPLVQLQSVEQALRAGLNNEMVSGVLTRTPVGQVAAQIAPTAEAMAAQATTKSLNPAVAVQAAQNVSGPARTLNPAAVARAFNPRLTPIEGLPAGNIRGVLSPPTPSAFEQMLRTNLGPVEENMAIIPRRSAARGIRAADKLLRSTNNQAILNQLTGQTVGGTPLSIEEVVAQQQLRSLSPANRLVGQVNQFLASPNPVGPSPQLALPSSTGQAGSLVRAASPGDLVARRGLIPSGGPANGYQLGNVTESFVGRPIASIGPTGNPGAIPPYTPPGLPGGGVGGGGAAGGGGFGGGGASGGTGPLAIGPGSGGGGGVPGGGVAGNPLVQAASKPGFFAYGPEGLSFATNANAVARLASRGFGVAPGLLAEQGALSSLAGPGLLRAAGAGLVQGAPLIAAQIANKGLDAFTPKQYQNDAGYRFTQGALTGAAVGSIIPGANLVTIPAGALIGGVGNTLKGWFDDRSATQQQTDNERRYARLGALMSTAGLTQQQRAAMKARYDTQVMLADGDANQVKSFLDQMEQQVVGMAGSNPYSLTGQDLIGLQAEIGKYMQPLQARMTASGAGLAGAYNQIASQMTNPQMADAARLQAANAQASADANNLAIARMGTYAPMNYAYTLDNSRPQTSTASLAGLTG